MFDFGPHLKNIRKSNSLTQKQLAQAIGASESGIQNYELGTRKPTYDMLIALADYFNVSTDYLLGRTDNPAGKLYKQAEIKEQKIDDFIEMCFDPNSSVNARLKDVLRKMMEEQE